MNKNRSEISRIPEGVAYAQIDSFVAQQDYAPGGLSIRATGVSKKSFEDGAFNTERGCETFVIDIGLSSFANAEILYATNAPKKWLVIVKYFAYWLRGSLKNWRAPRYANDINDLGCGQYCEFLNDWDDLDGDGRISEALLPKLWLEIRYRPATRVTDVYAYEAFSEEASLPQYLDLISVSVINGAEVTPPEESGEVSFNFDRSEEKPTLRAFHVGQGMCTLLANSEEGVLFDVGAGTPVTRDVYRKNHHSDGSVFANDLLSAINSLKDLKVVLSHADSDHWRVLEWDNSLLRKASKILVPNGQPFLAFKSPTVLATGKVSGINDATFTFASGDSLNLFRSQPSKSDKNGECLVAVAKIDGRSALLAGDYAYCRMKTDQRGDSAIASLVGQNFDAVVVPHHGDRASADSVPLPAVPGKSPAFFSAGTHRRYRHPRYVSLAAHNDVKYDVIDNHTLRNILSKQLLP